VEPIVARKVRHTTEPYHGLIYFVPEAASRYAELGIDGFAGYFGSRAAAMGEVTAATVTATFFNFRPQLVEDAIPACWAAASPARWWEARVAAVDAALRRILGDEHAGAPETRRAADLVVTAAQSARTDGRPLAAAHAARPIPEEPHLALWWGLTVLREHRGDGHISALVDAELSGCEALVLHAASGEVPRSALQGTRAWSDDEWAAAVEALAGRGLVDADGAFTEAGRTLRERIEDRTDHLARQPLEAIGEPGAAELRELVRPSSKAIVSGDDFGFARSR
jgi:GNAT superfamily N-acetyltransferase